MEFLFLSVSRGLWNAQTLQTHTQQGQEKKGSRLAPEPFQEHSEEECGKGAADRKPRGNLTLSSAGWAHPLPPPPFPQREQSNFKPPYPLSVLQPRAATGLLFPEDTLIHLAMLGTPESTGCSIARRRLGGWLHNRPCHLQGRWLATPPALTLTHF